MTGAFDAASPRAMALFAQRTKWIRVPKVLSVSSSPGAPEPNS